jgi:hypothetical protein
MGICFLFIILQVILGAINGEFALAQQKIDELQVLDIFYPEQAVALSCFPGLQDIKFIFPVPQ